MGASSTARPLPMPEVGSACSPSAGTGRAWREGCEGLRLSVDRYAVSLAWAHALSQVVAAAAAVKDISPSAVPLNLAGRIGLRSQASRSPSVLSHRVLSPPGSLPLSAPGVPFCMEWPALR